MVLPPNDKNTEIYFKRISEKNKLLNLPELSMGMTADYDLAIKHYSTYLRIGQLYLEIETSNNNFSLIINLIKNFPHISFRYSNASLSFFIIIFCYM